MCLECRILALILFHRMFCVSTVIACFACSMQSSVLMLTEQDVKVQSTQSSLTSSGISLVTSILNDQQSRMSGVTGDSIRLPSPPLIEPRYSALSR